MPSYQAGVVPSGMQPGRESPRRAEPDIAMDADPQTGVMFAQTYVLPNGRHQIIDSWIGGTSLASPLVAGVMALADQASGFPHGFINPELYALEGTPALHDITGGHRSLAVLRNALQPDGSIVTTRLRALDRDSSLRTRRLGPGHGPRLATCRRSWLRYADRLRVCSLLPSATEIVGALGCVDLLVARSAECDRPAGVDLPVVTAARIDSEGLRSGQIDAAVRGRGARRARRCTRSTTS